MPGLRLQSDMNQQTFLRQSPPEQNQSGYDQKLAEGDLAEHLIVRASVRTKRARNRSPTCIPNKPSRLNA